MLISCGTKRQLTNADGTQPVQRDKIAGDVQNSRNAAEQGNLYCSFSGECNPAVTLISVVTDEGIERCTGFLISDHEVMTNDHCIEKSISLEGWETRRKDIPCQNFVFTHFVGSDPTGPGMTVGCDSIEIRSGETGIASQDYAIIKLKTKVTDRPPLKLSERGFKDAEKAVLYRVQMQSDGTQSGFSGMQTKLECQASYATYLFPSVTVAQSQLMTFGDCAIQSGNSGSPIFNADGDVSAIVQGYLTAKEDPEVKAELAGDLLDPSYGLVAIGTQVPCMHDVPGINPRGCLSAYEMRAMLPDDYLSHFGSFSTSVLPKADAGHEWREIFPETGVSKTYIEVPSCENDLKFNGIVMPYKKGLNRFMQTEWRAQNAVGEKLASFATTAGGQSFVNDTFGVLHIDSCNLP